MAGIEKITIKVTRLDFEHLTLGGKDRFYHEHFFFLRPETLVYRSSAEPGRPVSELGRIGFPFVLGKEVEIAWKTEADGKRVAVRMRVP